jgi:hypothetical protein
LSDGLLLCFAVFCCVVQEAIISHGCTVKSSSISDAAAGLRSPWHLMWHIKEGCFTLDIKRKRLLRYRAPAVQLYALLVALVKWTNPQTTPEGS